MNKDLEMKINGLEKEICSAHQTLEKAEGRLKGLKEELAKLKEMKKVPMMYGFCGDSHEIVHYRRYSDDFIEFTLANGRRYRYIAIYTSITNTYPHKNLKGTVNKIRSVFQCMFSDGYANSYVVDHIELLEGVNEYDKA